MFGSGMAAINAVATMLKAGVGPNVIPSEAEATLDIRAFPGEDIDKLYAAMAKVINDLAVKIVPMPQTRPPSPASRSTPPRGCWPTSSAPAFSSSRLRPEAVSDRRSCFRGAGV